MNYNLINGDKTLDFFKTKLSSIRTGRVNATVLDPIQVDAYGTKMSIVEIATVTVPEPGQLMITPFDKNLIKDIQKAISDSNLGVNPSDDGAGVRLNFPPLTEENKKARLKEVGALLEESKITVRSNRQDLLKGQKRKAEAGEISEDDVKRFEKNLQDEVNSLNKELEEIAKQKEDDLMKV